jgi:thiamine biosynthesis lipoprotein
MKRIEFRAMGSRMLAVLDSTARQAEEALESVPAWFEEWEQVLSRFRPGNELDRLNRSDGRPMAISRTLWDVFHAARTAEQFTGGLVAPTILDALVGAGYDRSFESLPPNHLCLQHPGLAAMACWRRQMGYSFALPGLPDPSGVIVWDVPTRSLIMPSSVHLDLGGIAKGWAADQAVQRLSRHGPALVDAGGDIAISRPLGDGQAWPIGINDPFHSGTHFETLKLARCGVATSGKDYHRWLKDGIWHHHIIDPRTGLPADTDVLAATVVAPTVMEAEAAAKAVLILGSQAGLDWLEADSGLAGILVLENGNRLYSRNMEKYLWRD